jgi:hypothetical protein
MAQASMTNTQKVPYVLDPRDADGNPAEVENFSVDFAGADLTLEKTDEKNGFIVSGSTLGTFPVVFSADARIGEGEVILTENHEITVTNPEATSLTGTFGSPVSK